MAKFLEEVDQEISREVPREDNLIQPDRSPTTLFVLVKVRFLMIYVGSQE